MIQGSAAGPFALQGIQKNERRKDIKNNSCFFEYPSPWQQLCLLLYIDSHLLFLLGELYSAPNCE